MARRRRSTANAPKFVDVSMFPEIEPENPTPGFFDDVPALAVQPPKPKAKRRQLAEIERDTLAVIGPRVPLFPAPATALTEGTPEDGFVVCAERIVDVEPEPAPCAPEPTELAQPDEDEEEAQIVISHTAETGTLLFGSVKGDGTWDLLPGAGRSWKTFRNAEANGYPRGTLYIPMSRDKAPKRHIINGAAKALRAADITVRVEIEAGPRDQAEVIADRIDRLEDRREALENKAGRRAAESNARQERADQISERFWMGQPILVGHHSEGRARRDQERMHDNMRKAIDLDEQAKHATEKAEETARNVEALKNGESPLRIARRIERLEAEERLILRKLNGYKRNSLNGKGQVYYVENHEPATGGYKLQLEEALAHLRPKLEYDRQQFAAAKAAGKLGNLDSVDWSQVAKGDQIKHGRTWHAVVRVNQKTVTVKTAYSWTDKLPKIEVSGHRKAADVPAEPVDVDAAAAEG
jgi:hypothetical protein